MGRSASISARALALQSSFGMGIYDFVITCAGEKDFLILRIGGSRVLFNQAVVNHRLSSAVSFTHICCVPRPFAIGISQSFSNRVPPFFCSHVHTPL